MLLTKCRRSGEVVQKGAYIGQYAFRVVAHPELPIFVLNAPDLLPSRRADNLLQEVIFR
jgi:hypothetical protein